MKLRRAHRMAREHSKTGLVFVAEWADEKGRFSAVAAREYYADDSCGQFFCEAVAAYKDGSRYE